uniref:Pseudouridine synthase RsuA/RluA-like domain-containing protein n=1 Tax=Pinguiococcus pyrenoidosus TaxID=172671 RepID=A0A6U0VH21_9STRA
MPRAVHEKFGSAYTGDGLQQLPPEGSGRGRPKPSGYRRPERVLDPGFPLEPGDYVRVYPVPARYPEALGIDWDKRILRMDADFVVVDKPAGIPSHATKDNLRENTLEQLRLHFAGEAFSDALRLPHRLDIDTSGVLIAAKSGAACGRIAASLQAASGEKRYAARVQRDESREEPCSLHDGLRLEHFQLRQTHGPHRFVTSSDDADAKHCALVVEKVHRESSDEANVSVRLLTGRTHQIRGQLSAVGWPIVGDNLYGSSDYPPTGFVRSPGLCLRSLEVTFQLHEASHTIQVPDRDAFAFR